MSQYEDRLKQYMAEHHVQAEHLFFSQSCHSVLEAAQAVNANPKDFVKSMCLIGNHGMLIVGIVNGHDRVEAERIAKLLSIEKPRIATPEEILEKTGYPCGGVPPFGYDAVFLIDPKIMEKELVYAGGGSEQSLIKISPAEMLKANTGSVERIRK